MNGERAPISLREALLGYLCAWVLGNILAAAVLAASGADTVADAGPGWFAALALAQWLPLVGALWMLAQRARTDNAAGSLRSFGRDYGLSFRASDALGIPIGVAAQLLLVPLLYLPLREIWPEVFDADDIEKRARDLWQSAGGAGSVLLIAIVVLGAPLVEELVYRGLLQGALVRRLPRLAGWLAVMIIAALFALVHFAPIEYPGLFLVGLVFGACALRTGRLGLSIVTHAAFNATGLALVANS